MKRQMARMGMAAVLAGALWGGQALGQDDQPTAPEHRHKDKNGKMGLSQEGKDFLMKAARGNSAEVSMGRLVQERAVNKDVKDFGARMVKDHNKFNEELTRLARKKGVTLPLDMTDGAREEVNKLQGLKGVELDREYMTFMVDEHQRDVDAYQQAMTQVKDPELMKWTQKTLPILQDHLKNARMINDKLKASQAAQR